MKIINNEAIKSTILDIAPHKIAVAYVGIDWKEYVNLSKDHIIIVSPTIGTNPDAVKQIADTIGWGNIYFLNELHAKIYIGVGAVLLSSSNLSRNGMEAEGLIEIGVLIESENERRIIEEEFNKILDKAESEYKDTESKKRALQKLYDKHRRAVANRIVSKNKSKNSFLDYRVLTDEDFYICWYTTGEVEYSDDYNMIRKNVEYEIHFRKGDTINPGKWVLMWKLTEANRPHKTLKPRVCNLPRFQPGVFCVVRSARISVALGCETKNDIHAGTTQSYDFSATPPPPKKHSATPPAQGPDPPP